MTAAREPLPPRPPITTEPPAADGRIGGLGLLDCAFRRPDLSGLDASGASLVRVAIDGGRLTGINAVGARLTDVVLRDCRMDLAGFAEARLERVTFERCDLREVDLQEARLHDVRFLACDLSGALLHGTDCTRTELRDCRYEGLHGIEGLRGTAIGWPDAIELAPAFAAALGIRVAPS